MTVWHKGPSSCTVVDIMSKHLFWFLFSLLSFSLSLLPSLTVRPHKLSACRKITDNSIALRYDAWVVIGFSSVSDKCSFSQTLALRADDWCETSVLCSTLAAFRRTVRLYNHSVFYSMSAWAILPFYSQIHQLTLNRVRSSDLCL